MIRPMRGQVVVRECHVAQFLWTPDANPRQVKTHQGVVLAMGAPARTPMSVDGERWIGGVEIPHGFEVGDVVQYHFEHHQEAWTMAWEDGSPATWLAQKNVDGVWS